MSNKEWYEKAITVFENKIENLQKAFDKLKDLKNNNRFTIDFALSEDRFTDSYNIEIKLFLSAIKKQLKFYSKYLKYLRKRYAFLLEYLENNVYNYEDFEKQRSSFKNK